MNEGIHERIYYGYIDSKGDVVIDARDINKGQTQSYVLHEALQVDDHNVPSLLSMPDGKIMTFYTEHSGRLFHAQEQQPGRHQLMGRRKDILLRFDRQTDLLFAPGYAVGRKPPHLYVLSRHHSGNVIHGVRIVFLLQRRQRKHMDRSAILSGYKSY